MDNQQAMVPVNGVQHSGTLVAREEFGKRELEVRHETAATAVATQAAELVRARYALARMHPRSWMKVREQLLDACRRPRFAEKARYAKPMGKKLNEETGEWEQQYARGFSIRFIEEAIRAMGNIDVETMVKFDNARQRILRIVVLDIETNNSYPSDILVEKTVERRKLKKGQAAISQRTNSYGETVFLVEATEDEMLTKAAALTSKAIRTNGERLVPGDIREECEQVIYATLSAENAKDPTAALKRLIDRLGGIGVSVEQVAQYLGHAVDTMTPEERQELIEIGTAIKEGSTSWAEVMEDRGEEKPAAQTEGTTSASTEPPRTAAELKAKAHAEMAKKPAAETQKPAEAPTQQDLAPPKKSTPPKSKKAPIMQEAENGHMVDPSDTGPCAFEEGGVVCDREAFNYEGVGYRCGEHAPPPAIK